MNCFWNLTQLPLEPVGGFNFSQGGSEAQSHYSASLLFYIYDLQYLYFKNIQRIKLNGSLVFGESCLRASFRWWKYNYQENISFLVH